MSPQINFSEPPLSTGDPVVLDRYLLELHNRVFGHGPDTLGDLDEENIDLTNINHAANHQDDGIDEINVAGLSGQLADLQLPVDHSHQSSGSGVGGKIDHILALTSIGTNTHAAIDTHIADDTLHFLEEAIDHGSIDAASLLDDDHTLYTLADGSRAFTGNQSFGDYNITNVGDISLDTISSDPGTSISVLLGTDAGDDFIVGNNNAFVVEGDTDFVGIGTNDPDYQLHQVPLGEAKIAAVSNTNLYFQGKEQYVAEFTTNDPDFAGFLVRSHSATGKPFIQLYNTITTDIWTMMLERVGDRLQFIHGTAASSEIPLTLTSPSNNLRIGVNEILPDAQLEIVTYSATDPGLKVKGSVSQSADLIRVTDNSDNIGFKVEADFDVVIGSGAAGKDYSLTFNGETNDGVMTWMEDEDYFKFSDDIFIGGEEIFGDKFKITSIGGYAVALTNKTGANTVAGQLVRADTANNDSVILTAAGDVECFGVFLDSGISDGSEAWVVVAGIADISHDDNVAAVRGNWVSTGVGAGYAATSTSPAAAPTHFEEIGHCIENVAAGGGGTHILARCVLHFN